ncbi:MAG: Crp/Fnr family transcriptional regulator [Acidobacteriota bacterium]
MPAVPSSIEHLLASSPIFSKIGPDDRARLAAAARLEVFSRNDCIFSEGHEPDYLYSVISGRVKVLKTTSAGKDVILEIFGAGDPLGAVAVYEGRPYPASAVALEETTCLLVPRREFFALLESYPTLVRGLLAGLTLRLVELTNRVAELTGGRMEPRLARLFLKLAHDQGRPEGHGVFVPVHLSRQEIADLTGTTVETAIRIMSRWAKQGVVRTERDGFIIADRGALEDLAQE